MIQETIVTTQNRSGLAHIAPMGIHVITRDGVYAASQSGAGAAITRDGVYAANPSERVQRSPKMVSMLQASRELAQRSPGIARMPQANRELAQQLTKNLSSCRFALRQR